MAKRVNLEFNGRTLELPDVNDCHPIFSIQQVTVETSLDYEKLRVTDRDGSRWETDFREEMDGGWRHYMRPI